MAKQNKRNREIAKSIDKTKKYDLQEAVSILKKVPHPKFDETVEIAFKLGVDLNAADQSIRGSLTLPHGTGKSRKVAVFCKGEAANKAKEAGADFVGDADLIEKINNGFLDFDVAVSTPEMMREVTKLGKILGPRGLMPSPKTGTVTDDIGSCLKEIKSGKIDFKMDKQGGIHVAIGKISFDEGELVENVRAVISAVSNSKPALFKGQFINSISLSSTMGPGLKV